MFLLLRGQSSVKNAPARRLYTHISVDYPYRITALFRNLSIAVREDYPVFRITCECVYGGIERARGVGLPVAQVFPAIRQDEETGLPLIPDEGWQ